MISVTIPAYNEEANIEALFERVSSALARLGRPWELILVNDGSTDGTGRIFDQLAERDPRVRVVHFPRNYGQTAAMMAGFDFAKGDIIVPMDADLQNEPQDIPNLLRKLDEGYDVVSGWRKERKDHPIRRNLPSTVANRLISWISGVRLHDYGCSLKAYRRDVLKGVKLYGEMHRFVPIYASWMGARIAEIPVAHYPRLHGASNYGMSRAFKVLCDLLVVKFLSHYAQKPMYVFGGVGVVSLAISVAGIGWALYLKVYEGVALVQTPLPLLVVMTGITGFMCILMGLLAEIIMRTYYESQNKSVYVVSATRNL